MNPLSLLLLLMPLWLSSPHYQVKDFDVHDLKAQHEQNLQHINRIHYLFNHKNPFHEDYNPNSTLTLTQTNLDDITLFINRFYVLPSTYVPNDLVNLKTLDYSHPSALLREEAAMAFISLRNDVKQNLGISIEARSAYRSYEAQVRLFNAYAKKDGYRKANTYSALPGQSEHQSGLALDIATSIGSYLNFKDTLAYPYLKAHAHKYGFIERYQKDFSHISGYIFEPWHWRYVGVELATYLFNEALTFDEYILNSLK
jgi:zinc D-Ala-D-Ala carboxypeptidase